MNKHFLDDIFDGLEEGAVFGLEEAATAISVKADSVDDPVAAFVLAQAAAFLSEHGIDGLSLAREQLDALLDGDNLDPDAIRQLPLYQRAPLLAAATEREVNARRTGDAALIAVGAFLGRLVRGFASGAFRGA